MLRTHVWSMLIVSTTHSAPCSSEPSLVSVDACYHASCLKTPHSIRTLIVIIHHHLCHYIPYSLSWLAVHCERMTLSSRIHYHYTNWQGLHIRKLTSTACSCRGVWLWQIRKLFGRFPAGNQHKCQDCHQIWAPALEVHLRLTCQSSQGVFC